MKGLPKKVFSFFSLEYRNAVDSRVLSWSLNGYGKAECEYTCSCAIWGAQYLEMSYDFIIWRNRTIAFSGS